MTSKKKYKEQKERKRNKILYRILITIYLVLTILLFFILLNLWLWIPVEECESCFKSIFQSFSLYITAFLLYILFGYIFHRLTKKIIFIVFAFFIPVIFLMFDYKMSIYLTDKKIENNISIVKQGVIEEKYCAKLGCWLTIIYDDDSKKKERNFSTREYKTDKLSVGDTILFVYVEKCEYIAKIYKYEPTKAELKKCKNDCYLINGKLIPVSEYKKSKNKELY